MAYPKHMLLTFGGPLGNSETWACGLRMTNDTMAAASDDGMAGFGPDYVQEVHGKVRTYLTAIGSNYLNGAGAHSWTKFNAIGPDGKYIGSVTGEVLMTTPAPLATSAPYPFQLATAITLQTASKRGIATAGRFFLPCSPSMVDMDGGMPEAWCLTLGQRTRDFIISLNNWTGFDLPVAPVVSVVSRGRQIAPGSYGTGAHRPVTEVRVGRVQDTQQRRRTHTAERHVPVAVPAGQ